MALIPRKGDSMQEQQKRVTGTVVNANERGFQFSGAEAWLNWSKYATEPRTLPAPGERIVALLDKAGFVRSVLRSEGVKPEVAQPSVKPQTVAHKTLADREFRLKCLSFVVDHAGWFGVDDAEWDTVTATTSQVLAWCEGVGS